MNRAKKKQQGRSEAERENAAQNMDPAEVEELRAAWELVKGEDDRVMVEDLLQEMRDSGLDQRFKPATNLLKDINNTEEDASLDFYEFLDLMNLDVRTAQDTNQLSQLFRLLKNENDDDLDSAALRKLFAEIGEEFTDEEWEKQFERLGSNDEGVFTYGNFLVAIGKGEDEEE